MEDRVSCARAAASSATRKATLRGTALSSALVEAVLRTEALVVAMTITVIGMRRTTGAHLREAARPAITEEMGTTWAVVWDPHPGDSSPGHPLAETTHAHLKTGTAVAVEEWTVTTAVTD